MLLLSQRYYDPRQGQFLTRDPLGYGGGMDLYAYASNSPAVFIDPLGLGPQRGQDWLRNTSNFLAGYGCAVSFGRIAMLWHVDGVDDEIDYQSGAFQAGQVAGIVHGVALLGVGTGAVQWLGARLTLLLGGGASASAAVEEEEEPHALGSWLLLEIDLRTSLTSLFRRRRCRR